jgi:predicted kinase
MRRLPEERMLDRLAVAGEVTNDELEQLADVLATFYQSIGTSERIARGGTVAAIEANVRANLKTLREIHPDCDEIDVLASTQLGFLAANRRRFEDRVSQGKIRDGHGDLRAEHVCMTSPPVVFDCIEFNDRLRHLDILDDIAFLLMDLETLGRDDLSRCLWMKLADRLRENPADPLLDFYRAYRASVRAKVEAIRETQVSSTSANHVRAARLGRDFLLKAAEYGRRMYPPRLLVTVGVMGTGKSTLADALADAIGAQRIASDVVRKELAGAEGRGAAFQKGPYSLEHTDRVYRSLFDRARTTLERGVSVILDATFSAQAQRAAARELARAVGAQPLFLECRTSKGEAIARLDRRYRRKRSESDGRPELYDDQLKCFEPTTDLPNGLLLALNTSQPVRDLVREVVNKFCCQRGSDAGPEPARDEAAPELSEGVAGKDSART